MRNTTGRKAFLVILLLAGLGAFFVPDEGSSARASLNAVPTTAVHALDVDVDAGPAGCQFKFKSPLAKWEKRPWFKYVAAAVIIAAIYLWFFK